MITRNNHRVKSAKLLNKALDTTATTTHRTRRKLTIENSHELHRNPYMSLPHRDPLMALAWAAEHHAICAECANRKTRRRRKLRWSECVCGCDEYDWHPHQIDGRIAAK